MPLPKPKYATVNAQNPEGWGVCDHCGFWRNRSDLTWQFEWGGNNLYNKEVIVCRDRCYDTPQEQLRTIILPPDPPPVVNARPPNFAVEEFTNIQFQFGGGSTLPPWGAGPQMEMMTQDRTTFICFQYTNTTATQIS